jgi:hypothetical protein
MQVYNDGTLKPVCTMLLWQGPYYDCLNLGRSEHVTAHLTPVHIYSFTPCMVIYNVPDSNGLASE